MRIASHLKGGIKNLSDEINLGKQEILASVAILPNPLLRVGVLPKG